MDMTDLYEPLCRLADGAGWPALGSIGVAMLALRANRTPIARFAAGAAILFAGIAALGELGFLLALFRLPSLMFAGGDHLSRETLAFLRAGIAPSWSRAVLTQVSLMLIACGLWRQAHRRALAAGRRWYLPGALVAAATAALSAAYGVLAATNPALLFPTDPRGPAELGTLPHSLVRQSMCDVAVSLAVVGLAWFWLAYSRPTPTPAPQSSA